MDKLLERGIKYLVGISAVNLGVSKFLNLDVFSYIPEGMITTGVIAAIAVSGGLVIYWTWKKQI